MYRIIATIMISAILILAAQISSAQENSARYDSLKSVLDTMPDCVQRLETNNAFIYSQIHVDSMQKYAQEGVRLSVKLKNKYWEANNYRLIGWCYTSKGLIDSAITYYYRAAEAFETVDSTKGLAYTYYGISELEELRGNLNEAIDYTITVITLGEEIGDCNMLALAYQRLGIIYNMLGASSEAIKYLKMAIRINDSLQNPMLLGNNYREYAMATMGQRPTLVQASSGKEILLMARKMFEDSNDNFDIIYTDCLLSETYLKIADLDSANTRQMLDSTVHYISSGKKICDMMGQHYFEMLLDIAYIKYLVKTKNVERANHIFDSISKIEITDTEITDNRHDIELLLLKANGMWQDALAMQKSIQKKHARQLIYEYDVKITKATSSNEFYMKMKEKEKLKTLREKQMADEKRFNETMYKIGMAVLLIAALVIFCLLISLRNKRNENSMLKKQNEDILRKHEELNLMHEEISAQNDQIGDYTKEITGQTMNLIAKNRMMVNALETAEMIQTAIMPSNDKLLKMFGEMLIYWKPFNIVSGDFYWAAEILGHRLIAVADCTGHGVPGALMSTLGISALNEIASGIQRTQKMLTAAEIMRILRKMIVSRIVRSSQDSEDSINDGMDIALCIMNPDGKTVQFSGAKRPLWLARDGKITIYKGDRITVGPDAMGENADFSNMEIEVRKDDIIYLFSDGITDQLSMPIDGKRKKFQSMQLKGILEEIHQVDFPTQWFIIDTDIQQWMGPDMEQTDDILLMGIRIE